MDGKKVPLFSWKDKEEEEDNTLIKPEQLLFTKRTGNKPGH